MDSGGECSSTSRRRSSLIVDLDPRNSPLSVIRKIEPSRTMRIPVDVFFTLTSSFHRAINLNFSSARLQRGEVLVNSEDLVLQSSIGPEECKLSALLLRHFFFYLPAMLEQPTWRAIVLREVDTIVSSIWAKQSRRLARVIFLTRSFYLVEFFLKWTKDELDLDEERFRYSMAGQGHQDLLCAVRLENSVYAYQSYLSQHLNFPNDSCFSQIARSIVYGITDAIKIPEALNEFHFFDELPDLPIDIVFSNLAWSDLLSVRCVSRRMSRIVSTHLRRAPLNLDRARFRDFNFKDALYRCSHHLSIPQRKFCSRDVIVFSYPELGRLFRLIGMEERILPLNPSVLKLVKETRLPRVTMQTEVVNYDQLKALFGDLSALFEIKLVFLSVQDDLARNRLIELAESECWSVKTNNKFNVHLVRESPMEVDSEQEDVGELISYTTHTVLKRRRLSLSRSTTSFNEKFGL